MELLVRLVVVGEGSARYQEILRAEWIRVIREVRRLHRERTGPITHHRRCGESITRLRLKLRHEHVADEVAHLLFRIFRDRRIRGVELLENAIESLDCFGRLRQSGQYRDFLLHAMEVAPNQPSLDGAGGLELLTSRGFEGVAGGVPGDVTDRNARAQCHEE